MPDFTNPYGPIDYGKDFNYYTKWTVNTVNFTTNCDILIPFSTYTVTFRLESGTRIEYSFNGVTVHGDMTDGYNSKNLDFVNRPISKIWFRGDGYVRVEAWGIR